MSDGDAPKRKCCRVGAAASDLRCYIVFYGLDVFICVLCSLLCLDGNGPGGVYIYHNGQIFRNSYHISS